MDDYESVLIVIRECFDRAEEWGDLQTYLWKGRLRIIAIGEKCFIRLEDGTTGELFAECPYDPNNNSVEPVRDSSRYFVLRIEDKDKGRHAFIGMGFQERSDAFDFQVALQDHIKHVRAEKEASLQAKKASLEPKKDYSLKEGQTISIVIGNHHHTSKRTRPQNESNESSADVPLLPPPPSTTSIKQQQHLMKSFSTVTNPSQITQNQVSSENSDFGGFVDSFS